MCITACESRAVLTRRVAVIRHLIILPPPMRTNTASQNNMSSTAKRFQFSLRNLFGATCWICICFWILSLRAALSIHDSSTSEEIVTMRQPYFYLASWTAFTAVGVLFGRQKSGMIIGALAALLTFGVTLVSTMQSPHYVDVGPREGLTHYIIKSVPRFESGK